MWSEKKKKKKNDADAGIGKKRKVRSTWNWFSATSRVMSLYLHRKYNQFQLQVRMRASA